MGTEADDIIIHPQKGRKEPVLPERAILVANPTEAQIAEHLMRERGAMHRYLYNSHLFVDRSRELSVVGPSLGAPAAGLIMEKLIALGARKITLFSCCGTINRNYGIGDVLVATSGIPGEGVSRYYGDRSCVTVCHEEAGRLRDFLGENGAGWHDGVIWSTDAPYRESRSMLNRLRQVDGVDGVDMEFTALCSIATFRKVRFSALFVISDELWGEAWKPGFSSHSYRQRCRSLLSSLITYSLEKT